MEWEIIVIICLGVVAAALAIALVAVLARGRGKGRRAEGVDVIDGVRYSRKDEIFTETGAAAVTHREGDVLLAVNVPVKAVRGGALMPGKYTVLCTNEGATTFNLRIGGFVRPYRHGDAVVIEEGDEVCAVSHSVILR